MRKEQDYIRQYEGEIAELDAIETPELTTKDKENIDRIINMAEKEEAERKPRKKNETLWKTWGEKLYPAMCKIAEIQGGRVTLEIDEKTFNGSLTYFGHDLIIDNIFCFDLETIKLVTKQANSMTVSAKDGLVELRFTFSVCEK